MFLRSCCYSSHVIQINLYMGVGGRQHTSGLQTMGKNLSLPWSLSDSVEVTLFSFFFIIIIATIMPT